LDYSRGIEKVLQNLHERYLKNNKYDEGDLIFYRINYKLEEMYEISRYQANGLHQTYHLSFPRKTSEVYCNSCDRVVRYIPIIYGVTQSEMEYMKALEKEDRILIGIVKDHKDTHMPLFACKLCKSPILNLDY
jgi:hypothetical protein